MKNQYFKLISIALFILSADVLSAQSQSEGSSFLVPLVIGAGVILGLWALLSLADNLMQIEAKKAGLDTKKNNFGVFPSISNLFSAKAPSFVEDTNKFHALTKGAEIKLAGEANKQYLESRVTRYALQPHLYLNMSPIPKTEFEIGDEVKAGEILFYDKKRPEIKYVSPVSGEIVDLVRGPKRAIHQIVVLADKDMQYVNHDVPSLESSREDIVNFMLNTGAWSHINQRPFDVVPDIDDVPRDIFISTFDTAPLAPDLNMVVEGRADDFQKGLEVLAKLTPGKVHLGMDGRGNLPSSVYTGAHGVEKHWFAGKHPAGNVGVQIHHISPIKATDKVWTLNVQDVLMLGKLFNDGIYDASKTIVVAGNELESTGYVKTFMGASINELLGSSIKGDNNRIIAGDVFSGRQVQDDAFLSHKEDQITVVKEGDNYELFGWLLPIKPRPSLSNTFPNFLFPDFKFEANTNTHGERRAFVVSGQYEEVLPMDIYPMHLMKAILANDYEKMEGLGLYELSEEDIALCEFSCTSKMPLQSILRQGLDAMRMQA